MHETKLKTQDELVSFLLAKRHNQLLTSRFEEKLKKIEQLDREHSTELQERREQQEAHRFQKIQRVFSEQELRERQCQLDRVAFQEEREIKLRKDEEREKELSKLNKLKSDKELELKRFHSMKRKELN